MLGQALDSFVGLISPKRGAMRAAWREQLGAVKAASGQHESMRKMFGAGRNSGYEAGKTDRLKGFDSGSTHENDLPRVQIERLRWRAWKFYRNNPQARKIVRTLGAKVVGRGLSPQPQAITTDGTPFADFRRRARQVWEEFAREADFRGKPGRGGQHLTSLSKTALRAVILSGGTLVRFRRLNTEQQKSLGLFLPLQLQLIHIDRLDSQANGKGKFYGLEYDTDGRVIAFHVKESGDAGAPTTRISADQMVHLFAEEDIDQFLGTPWVGAALLTADDRRNYEYSELIAAEMGSCIVAGYRRSNGQSGGLGLPGPDANYQLTDGDGNKITRLQPGMFVDLGQTGELESFNPARPNTGMPEFVSHLVRGEAVSVPGVKSSTLTGDYRNSSFSSERSADNDIWPELEEIQDWFAAGWCQPIYEEVISTAVAAGLFADIDGFEVADFNARKRDYLKTNWQGPVPRSINPKDDADAARSRVKNGTSTPQRECAQIGRDWREILQELDEFISYAEELGLPEDIWQQALGIDQSDSPAAPAEQPAPTEQEQDDAFARMRNSGFVGLNTASVP